MITSMFWQILYWIWVTAEIAILILKRTRNTGGIVRDRSSLLILWPVIVVSITAGTWVGETHPHTIFNGAFWVRIDATAMLAAGLVIRWIAIAALGSSFSANVAIHATQTVHKTGLFRFVRHPSYSGLLLILAAIGLHTRNWIGFAMVFIPPTTALLYRIHVEEAVLRQAFGDEYTSYSSTTKRLIPGIY